MSGHGVAAAAACFGAAAIFGADPAAFAATDPLVAFGAAAEAGETKRIPELMSDKWLADTTLFGSVSDVMDGVAAWREAGIRTPLLVPSSAAGNQMKALEEMFAAYA